MWHNAHGASFGTVLGSQQNADGLARSPQSNYQSMFRSGSHQSCTRGFIKPTHMTDSLNVKDLLSQVITQGFVPDVHCPTGAPRESMVRITRAEAGGMNGVGLWRPAQKGLRPLYENAMLKNFIAGKYSSIS